MGAYPEVRWPLKPLFGPDYTGIRSMGNSCYLNFVVQVLFGFPDFQRKYVDKLEKILQNAPTDSTQEFSTQVAKLGHTLLSGENFKPSPISLTTPSTPPTFPTFFHSQPNIHSSERVSQHITLGNLTHHSREEDRGSAP